MSKRILSILLALALLLCSTVAYADVELDGQPEELDEPPMGELAGGGIVLSIRKKADPETYKRLLTGTGLHVVNSKVLFVREGPDVTAAKLGRLKLGDVVDVKEIMPANWAKIESDGATAYVGGDYLAPVITEDNSTKYVVTANILTVRQGPGTSYSKLGTLKRSTVVYGTEVENTGWVMIKFGNATGYVSGKYLLEVME